MASFDQTWTRNPSDGILSQISNVFKRQSPLKPRVEHAIRGLNRPISKLDNTSKQLNQMMLNYLTELCKHNKTKIHVQAKFLQMN